MAPIEVIREEGFTFAVWLLKGLICSNLPRAEVERKLAQHPPGTTWGWRIEGTPIPCTECEGFTDYVVVC